METCFKLERRKGKTPDGTLLATDWLVPAWAHDDLTAARPCAEQSCLHRVLADCQHDRIVHLAGMYGLLTATGKILPQEPVDVWHREIRALRNATALSDAIAAEDAAALRRVLPQHQAAKGKEQFRLAREHLARRVTERMADGRFELIAAPDDGPRFVIRHRPVKLLGAMAALLRGDRGHHHVCQMPGSKLRPMVPPEHRRERPKILAPTGARRKQLRAGRDGDAK